MNNSVLDYFENNELINQKLYGFRRRDALAIFFLSYFIVGIIFLDRHVITQAIRKTLDKVLSITYFYYNLITEI